MKTAARTIHLKYFSYRMTVRTYWKRIAFKSTNNALGTLRVTRNIVYYNLIKESGFSLKKLNCNL